MDLKIETLSNPVLDRLRLNFKRLYTSGSIRISPPGTAMNASYADHVTRITSFQVRDDDVWVITFPKTGTTWTQEMTWLLVNDLDYRGATTTLLEDRFPFIEFSTTWMPSIEGPIRDTITYTESCPSPRCIKSHLPKDNLPTSLWEKKPKIIYVYRDPKDVAVSYYYHNCLINGYTGTKELFFEAFMEDVVMFGPFWEHVLEFWKLRDEPNVFFNTFDEMKQDLPGVIRKIAKFLGKTISEEAVSKMAEHLSFPRMRDNSNVNSDNRREAWESRQLTTIPGLTFIRRGESGSWREEMTSDMARRFDQWTRDKIANTDFPYTFSNL